MLGMQHILLQKIGEVKENPIGLDRMLAKQISDGLNVVLSSASSLGHQLKKHRRVALGPGFSDLEGLLERLTSHLTDIVDQVAERIMVLGAYPISTPRKRQEMSLFVHEEEGVLDARMMMANDLHAYQMIIGRCRELIRLAAQTGDYGTETMLRAHLLMLETDTYRLSRLSGIFQL